jgi:hypothetical protein
LRSAKSAAPTIGQRVKKCMFTDMSRPHRMKNRLRIRIRNFATSMRPNLRMAVRIEFWGGLTNPLPVVIL